MKIAPGETAIFRLRTARLAIIKPAASVEPFARTMERTTDLFAPEITERVCEGTLR